MTARLTGKRIVLRPLDMADRSRLRDILAEPEVARWWGPGDAEQAVDSWYVDAQTTFAIELDGTVIGSVQYSEELDPDYRHAGIDLFLTTPFHGQGLGGDAVRTIARHLFLDRGHHRITIDPAATNELAIRAYRRIGFQPVGVMRNYERASDGTWHDGLLLDLLPRDLT